MIKKNLSLYIAFLIFAPLSILTVGLTGYWRDDFIYYLPMGINSFFNGYLSFHLAWSFLDMFVLVLLSSVISLFITKNHDSECRCRKCGYILKGIKKPECPECGEPI